MSRFLNPGTVERFFGNSLLAVGGRRSRRKTATMIKSHLARRETPKVQSTVVDVLVCDSAIHRDSGCGVPNAMGSEPSSHKYPGFRQVVLGTPGKLLGSNSENPLPFRDRPAFKLRPGKTFHFVHRRLFAGRRPGQPRDCAPAHRVPPRSAHAPDPDH